MTEALPRKLDFPTGENPNHVPIGKITLFSSYELIKCPACESKTVGWKIMLENGHCPECGNRI